MIAKQLIHPQSIAIVGASDDYSKPGGRVLKNLIESHFPGRLVPVNPKSEEIQGLKTVSSITDLPPIDLGILAIPARFCPDTVRELVVEKGAKGIIIFSAGFSELGIEGKTMEREIAEIANAHGATIIGPNCIGMMNTFHSSVFTEPVPILNSHGCELVSGSGATCVFIMESALCRGLSFSSVYSVGNAAQTGIEDVLAYLDEAYISGQSSSTLLLYIESISKPAMFLEHARSLVEKGCHIAAIKAGSSEAGSRAAASHTGAMLSSDMAVEALLNKAGVIRCYGREELCSVGAVLQHKPLRGNRLAIITNAGGPGVMLTDALSKIEMSVPSLSDTGAERLLSDLFDGSSVANPIDILATGTPQQLEICIDYCDKEAQEVDGIIIIFGSPGLRSLTDVYELLLKKQKSCRKPLYVVMPSVLNTKSDMEEYVRRGGLFFQDEVGLAQALSKVYHSHAPNKTQLASLPQLDEIRALVNRNASGLLPTSEALHLLDLSGINRPQEAIVTSAKAAVEKAKSIGYPLAIKVVGPAHKSELGGVALGIADPVTVETTYERMMRIEGAEGVQVSEMIDGVEVMIGVKKEGAYGHLITCGLGGIFVEVMKDIQVALSPLSFEEALGMVGRLKSYPIIKGIRGKQGIDEDLIARTLCQVSALVAAAPEIEEMDINPLIGRGERLVAVDVVVKLQK